jgi:hypothetical protein
MKFLKIFNRRVNKQPEDDFTVIITTASVKSGISGMAN